MLVTKYPVYNQKGEVVKEYSLNNQVFGLKANPILIHQIVVAQLANARQITAHTKNRGEVSGGGKKPWKQKGTGRARQGSIRAPQWKGGGVVFGPRKDRNFLQKINKKMKSKAFLISLSDKVRNNKLIIFDKIELEVAKTKKMAQIIQTFISQGYIKSLTSKVLLGLPNNSKDIVRATKNLPNITTYHADSLNITDILRAKYLMLSLDSIKKIESQYAKNADSSLKAVKEVEN